MMMKMKLTIKQLGKLTREQHKQLKLKDKQRKCKHTHTTWGVCDRCKEVVDPDSVEEFKRVHPHLTKERHTNEQINKGIIE